jgi:cytoskeletal protein RodZ
LGETSNFQTGSETIVTTLETKTMQTVGEYLKKERQARDLSVREISQATKISQCYLEFLERDEYGKLPQGPYIKGYISSYARMINVDVERALKLYETKQQTPKNSAAIGLEKRSLHTTKRLTAEERKQTSDQPGKTAAVAVGHLKGWSTKIAGMLFKAIGNVLKSLRQVLEGISAICKAMILWSIKTYTSVLSTKTHLPTQPSEYAGYQSKTDAAVRTRKKQSTLLPILQWLRNPRRWLVGCAVGIIIAILILAGFGFYHLFIYKKYPPLPYDALKQPDQPVNQTVLPDDVDPRFSQKGPKEIVPELGRTSAKKALSSAETVTTRSSKDALMEDDNISKPAEESIHGALPIFPQKAAKTTSSKSASMEKPSVNKAPRPSLPAKPHSSAPSNAPHTLSTSPSATGSVRIIKASICQKITGRMPTNVDNTFPWSTPQVYVWSLISAEKIPTVIHHVYYLNGEKVSDVTLNVGSYHWRTWSRKRILDKDLKGSWRVDITTAKGQVLRTLFFEIY